MIQMIAAGTALGAQAADTVATVSPHGFAEMTLDFSKLEASHWVLCTIGYVVCFLVLLGLTILFSLFQKVLEARTRRTAEATGVPLQDTSGEIDAAIALALHLHFGAIHDRESTVLTIERRQATYSPWSSKIYGVRGFGQRAQRPVGGLPNRFPLRVQEH